MSPTKIKFGFPATVVPDKFKHTGAGDSDEKNKDDIVNVVGKSLAPDRAYPGRKNLKKLPAGRPCLAEAARRAKAKPKKAPSKKAQLAKLSRLPGDFRKLTTDFFLKQDAAISALHEKDPLSCGNLIDKSVKELLKMGEGVLSQICSKHHIKVADSVAGTVSKQCFFKGFLNSRIR